MIYCHKHYQNLTKNYFHQLILINPWHFSKKILIKCINLCHFKSISHLNYKYNNKYNKKKKIKKNL